MDFKLRVGDEHIALNVLLKLMHLVGTGGEAKQRIASGEVKVNGTVELRKTCKIRSGDVVQFKGHILKIISEP